MAAAFRGSPRGYGYAGPVAPQRGYSGYVGTPMREGRVAPQGLQMQRYPMAGSPAMAMQMQGSPVVMQGSPEYALAYQSPYGQPIVDGFLGTLVNSLEVFGDTLLQGVGTACAVMTCTDAGSPGAGSPCLPGSPMLMSPVPQYQAYQQAPPPQYPIGVQRVLERDARWEEEGRLEHPMPEWQQQPRPGCRICGVLVECPDDDCGAPDLRVPFVDPEIFEFSCALVASAWEGDEWVGRWRLREEEKARLLETIDSGRDGKLSLEEILAFKRLPHAKELMSHMPGSARGLLNPAFVKRVFRDYDTDGSGSLDISEWAGFTDTLTNLHLQYMVEKASIGFRAFWGRSARWNLSPGQDQNIPAWEVLQHASRDLSWMERPAEAQPARSTPSCLQIGRDPDARGGSLLAPGWWADLYYYSANNHPLHGIFAADPLHPLSRLERLAMETALMGFLIFAMSDELLRDAEIAMSSGSLTFIHHASHSSLVRVTIPSMVGWWALFLLFTCPCMIVDESQSASTLCPKIVRRLSATIGYLLVLLGIFCLVCEVVFTTLHVDIWKVVRGRLRGYVFSWVLEVGIYFNPFVAWGQPDPKKTGSLCRGMFGFCGDMVGLGQWRIEKQLFQARCAANVQRWKDWDWSGDQHETPQKPFRDYGDHADHRSAAMRHATPQSAHTLHTRLSAAAAARAPIATPPSSRHSSR